MNIEFRVSPNAKTTRAVSVDEKGIVHTRLAAPPVDGKANAELVRWLADALGIRHRYVTILRGHTSKTKIVSVSGFERDEVLHLLFPEASAAATRPLPSKKA